MWGFHPSAETVACKLVRDFFAHEFARAIPAGSEHLYKISVALAERVYLYPLTECGASEETARADKIGAIIYPAVAMRANVDNLALLPDFVDRYLTLHSVEWIRIDSRRDFSFEVTPVDFADTFRPDGTIEWKGRRARWQVAPGDTVLVRVENGRYVVRAKDGRMVEPT